MNAKRTRRPPRGDLDASAAGTKPLAERDEAARGPTQSSAIRQAMAHENVRVGAGHASASAETRQGLRSPGYMATIVAIVLLVAIALWVALS